MENKNEFYYTEEVNNEKIDNVVEKKNNNGKNKNIVFIMCVVFALTMGVIIGNISTKSDDLEVKEKIVESSSNPYSNIIKTSTFNEGEEFSIKTIASLTSDSVVEITTETVVRGSRLGQFVSEGAGSGVIISPDGYIVTNNHVIDGANKIMIKLKNEGVYEAKLIGRSAESDIAVIKIEETNLSPVVLGDSDKLVVGDTAVVVGNPLGSGATVTNGIISAKDREIDLGDIVMNLLQTNAAVNPGNSGGGLFNGRGELVGIVIAKSAGSDIEGIGFAIPINDIKDTILEIKEYGYIRGRVMLGVNLLEITDAWDAMMYRVDSTGVYIKSVEEDSDAEKFGLKSGDRIVSIEGKTVKSSSDIKEVLVKKSPKDEVTLVINRNSREYTVKITLSEYKGE